MSMQGDPWTDSLEDVARHAWKLTSGNAEMRGNALTAMLQARVALKVAEDQQKLARALNESADKTAAATRDLVKATNLVALFTVLAALAAVAAAVVAIVALP